MHRAAAYSIRSTVTAWGSRTGERRARQHAIAVLALLNGRPHLVGGAGSFVIVAEDYNSFGRAMVKKLIAEIAYGG